MFKTMYISLVRRRPILVVLAILLIVVSTTDSSVLQISASPALQQPARFLSPPFYGTTKVNSVYDHEYPTYGSPPNDTAPDVVHYDGTRNGPGARQFYDGHNGIDYNLDYELVRSAAPGNVVSAGWDNPAVHGGSEAARLGLRVIVEHDNGYDTLYGHMSVLRVRTGDQGICEAGEFSCILGTSGDTGWSDGPHLHFEFEPPGSDYSVNPYGWIGGTGLDPWENHTSNDLPKYGIPHTSLDLWMHYPSITNSDVYPSGSPLTAPPIDEDEPGYATVDDGDSDYSETPGCWTVNNTVGWAGDHRYRDVMGSDCFATWDFPSSQSPGYYNIFVHVPDVTLTTDAARYRIRHAESPSSPWNPQHAWSVVNQSVYPNTYHPSSWVYIGTYYFNSQAGINYVKLLADPLDPVGTTRMAADAVRFAPVVYRHYLPLVIKRWPPIPDIPVLHPIDNPSGDPDYVVDWDPADLATSYTVQEATDASFSDAVTRYSGPGTIWFVYNQPPGTYYYRVKATNSWGDSGWSNIQQTTVFPPEWLYVAFDAMVLSGYPNENYGDNWDMWAGYDTSLDPDGQTARSLVQFHLSQIPEDTPISQATLWLYLSTSDDVEATSRVIEAYRVTSIWKELLVTWNTRPSYSGMYGWVSVPHDVEDWYVIDVTDLAREWINGQSTNYGVWLFGVESPAHPNWRGFCTHEHEICQGAWLQISYSEAMGAPAPPEAPSAMPEMFISPLPVPEAMPEMFLSPLPTPVSPEIVPEQ